MIKFGTMGSVRENDARTLPEDAFVNLFDGLREGVYIGLVGPDSTATFAANPWETSGIVEVPGSTGSATILFDTQAHGFPAPGYVEGGQLLIAFPD